MGEDLTSSSYSSSNKPSAIDSSNIGFRLLKKHGWKEGTGLGASQQGRLEPIKTYLKNNKRGLGADKITKTAKSPNDTAASNQKNVQDQLPSKKRKAASKRIMKMQELEKQLQEKEFERAFYREFWPDNV